MGTTSETNFTPGPWFVFDVGGENEVHSIQDGTPVMVCQVSRGSFESDVGPSYLITRKEAEANARLIAAAPELLDLAKEASAELELFKASQTNLGRIRQLETLIEKLDAAIAKAVA